MKRTYAWEAAGTAMLLIALTFAGAAGASALNGTSSGDTIGVPAPPAPPTKGDPVRETPTVTAPKPPPTTGSDAGTRLAVTMQAVRPGCPAPIGGTVGSAPSKISPKGVAGTSSSDLSSFALAFNSTRIANCLRPVPLANFRYDACMESRLFWMAEDPSTDPSSAWGHIGTKRSDGVPSVGCDGNLAGGMNNTGATVATKWWQSTAHRASLYKPSYTGSTAGVCIYYAITHGGVPNEPFAFTRAASRWGSC